MRHSPGPAPPAPGTILGRLHETIAGHGAHASAIGGQARAEERAAYAFLTPWLIGIVVFLLIPLVYSVWISLTDEQLLRPGSFVGLDNYVTILGGGDPYFWKAMQVTFSLGPADGAPVHGRPAWASRCC